MRETPTDAARQCCEVHFLRNVLDYLLRQAGDHCRQKLPWIYDRRDIQKASRNQAAWIGQ